MITIFLMARIEWMTLERFGGLGKVSQGSHHTDKVSRWHLGIFVDCARCRDTRDRIRGKTTNLVDAPDSETGLGR